MLFSLDPKINKVYTEPSKTVWSGANLDLPCDFYGTPTQVLWNKEEQHGSSTRIETVLRFLGGAREVTGDKRFGWGRNFGLFLSDLTVLDRGNFTCEVRKTDDTILENTTVLTVHGMSVST